MHNIALLRYAVSHPDPLLLCKLRSGAESQHAVHTDATGLLLSLGNRLLQIKRNNESVLMSALVQGALTGRPAALAGKTISPGRIVKETRLVAHAQGKPKEEKLEKKSDEQKKESKEGGDDKKGGAVAKVSASYAYQCLLKHHLPCKLYQLFEN